MAERCLPPLLQSWQVLASHKRRQLGRYALMLCISSISLSLPTAATSHFGATTTMADPGLDTCSQCRCSSSVLAIHEGQLHLSLLQKGQGLFNLYVGHAVLHAVVSSLTPNCNCIICHPG